MERDRYSANEDAYGAVTSDGLFGRDAVEVAAQVEPLTAVPPRFVVNVDDGAAATPNLNDESGAWYLTPLAAFGAAAALALGVFAGGNLLLNHGDQITAFWNGHDDPPVIAERAFAAAVTTLRPDRPRLAHKPKIKETLPVEPETDFSESPEYFPVEFFEEQREEAGNRRDKRFKDLEKIRERQQKNLKDFLDSIENLEDN